MTSIDFFAIKERIVDILKNDTSNIYSATPTNKNLFRKIEAGAPKSDIIRQGPFPRMWVTNDDIFADITVDTTVASNTPNTSFYTMRFLIIYVVDAKDGPKAEEKIDDFTKVIIEKLQTDYDLRTIGGLESTRLADKSEVEQVAILNRDFTGQDVLGRVIRFKVMKAI